MAKARRRQAQLEKWYVRALPFAFATGVLGFILGGILNLVLAANGYDDASLVAIAGAAGFLGAFVVLGIVELSGAAAARVYGGSPSTVSHPDFSYADSLAARGLYDGAVAAYRNAAEESPETPEPLLRAARVLRDALERYPEAVELLREARAHPSADERFDELVTREIVEIHVNRLDEPARALPELARLIERYPDSPGAEWARRRIAELRTQVWESVKEGRPDRS